MCVRVCAHACMFVCDITGVSRPAAFNDWSPEGPSPPEFALIPCWIKVELWANPLLRSLPLLLCGTEGGFNPSGLRRKLGESGREAADRLQRQQKSPTATALLQPEAHPSSLGG